MEIYYCPACSGKPYVRSLKNGTKCPVCKTALRFEDVSESSLKGRPELSPEKKTSKEKPEKKTKKANSTSAEKYKKYKSLSGIVENIRPSRPDPRGFFTKLRHYLMYGQGWSDTLYSFDIKPRDDETGNDRVRVHIYGDYHGDGATICSGFDHTVKGRMAFNNVSEDDNGIYFARYIRNNDTKIRFASSPVAFMLTVFFFFFCYKVVMALKDSFMSGTVLDEIRRVFEDFVPSAKAATSMFSIAFIIVSAIFYISRNRTHIKYDFASVSVLSLMITVLFFFKYKLSQFADLTVSESFSVILAIIVTSLLKILAALAVLYLVWQVMQFIKRMRGL